MNDADISYHDPNMMIGYLDAVDEIAALGNTSLPKFVSFGAEEASSNNWGGQNF